ncbi:hypothetical protein KY290_037929 [Solanum tuberosum]|uniref:Uncharacterized protein n=1 Tax=Solanum tuberosum TaxID=4113 RepID=A0ABQ7TWY5_SOLTU|nr:hypothetical protein KY289_037496 [Solanum tuberosum]KAH0640694.1 hypothetical protein KY285_037280 [Solanum tuberosum]KAH0739224.1 hypothetical protein KY290_037929 [Solanum tuberosum]
MELPLDYGVHNFIQSLTSQPRLKFIDISLDEKTSSGFLNNHETFLYNFIDGHKSLVREYVHNICKTSSCYGFILDMFCTSMIDIANEFNVPSYIYFASNASFLGLCLHFETLRNEQHSDTSSMGSFEAEQIKEIATALEHCGHRFLWSLRKSPPKGKVDIPTSYNNYEEVLPKGFLERTKERGKIIGWAPQVTILSHPSIGGFVSHCGWNSILESVHFGVPIATWPLYAEQQMNAFLLVKELGLGEEIKLDYVVDFEGRNNQVDIVSAQEIESGLLKLMVKSEENEVRKKMKEMKEKSRVAMEEGGSSYNSLGLLIKDVITNI